MLTFATLLHVGRYVGYKEMRGTMTLVCRSWVDGICSSLSHAWHYFPQIKGLENPSCSFELPCGMNILESTQRFGASVATLVQVEKEYVAYFWTPRGECLKQVKLRHARRCSRRCFRFHNQSFRKCKDRQIKIFHQTKEKDGYLIWQLIYTWGLDCAAQYRVIFKDTSSASTIFKDMLTKEECIPSSSLYCVLCIEKTIYFYTLNGKLVCQWNFVPDPIFFETCPSCGESRRCIYFNAWSTAGVQLRRKIKTDFIEQGIPMLDSFSCAS